MSQEAAEQTGAAHEGKTGAPFNVNKSFVAKLLRKIRFHAFRSYLGALLLIWAAGLVMRLVYAYSVWASPTYADAKGYIVSALNLFHKDLMSTYMLWPPGYPFFISLHFRLFGMDSVGPILVTQAFLDSGTVLLIASIARLLFSGRTALIAALMYALYRPGLLCTGLVMSETLSVFLLALILRSSILLLRKGSWRQALLLGLWIALAAHVRTNMLAVIPPIGIAALVPLFRRGRRPDFRLPIRVAGACTLALVLLIPWSVRNSVIVKRPAFLAVNSGLNMAYTNHPASVGHSVGYKYTYDYVQEKYPETRGKPWFDQDPYLGQLARDFLKSYPLYNALYLFPTRLAMLLGVFPEHPQADAHWPWYDIKEGGNLQLSPFGPRLWIPTINSFLPVLVLGAAGLLFPGRRPRWFLPCMWIFLILPLLVAPPNARYRIPMDFLLVIGAGELLCRAIGRVSVPRVLRRVSAGLAAAALIGSLARSYYFSGPNLLTIPALIASETPALRAMADPDQGYVHSAVSRDPKDKNVQTVPLGRLRVDPRRQPHLLYSFLFSADLPLENMEQYGRGPNITLTYLDEQEKPISSLHTPKALVGTESSLNYFARDGAWVWRIVRMPAWARYVDLQLTNNLAAPVRIRNLQVKGALGYAE